mmetsp:Transcript_26619/g.35577  ORF Transcript_26619/g.35577 Transcript_26619/m.35577 type:complete len:203 (-) Transcript_26619:344-952(-)
MEGKIFKRKSKAVSVAEAINSRLAFSSVTADSAVFSTAPISNFPTCFITASLVIPAFSTAPITLPTTLFPLLLCCAPSSASRTRSPAVIRFSPAATTSSLFIILATSSTSLDIVNSPDKIFLTCPKTDRMVSSETDSSAASSCFSISFAALRAMGSNNAAVPPSPLARKAIASGDNSSPSCDSKSTMTCSILNIATFLYLLR